MRGLICVMRVVNGKEEILPLETQWHYKEYYGCFSFI